jgi:hypothetical protein
MTDETKTIDVIMGPYRGHRLTVSAADADAAVNGHWATDPNAVSEPDHEPHPPLSEQERTEALTAATTWAQLQWDTAQQVPPPDPPPPEGGEGGITRRRSMTPDKSPGSGYQTRHVEPKS